MSEVNFQEPFSRGNQIKRLIWSVTWAVFARPFPRSMARKWKIILLRLFGARIDSTSIVYSTANISMPWNLIMKEYSCIGNNVIIENSAVVTLEPYSIISQYTYLCTATHDIRDNDFPQYSKPIILGRRCWISARCFIGPGVKIGEGAVVGAASSVFKNVEPWTVVGGNPAKIINKRIIIERDGV